MDILVIGDSHNDIENNFSYIDKLKEFKFDAIVYMGDFTDVNIPKGFKQRDIAKIIIEELKSLGKPVFAVPGNNDDLDVLGVMEDSGISVHGKGIGLGEYGFSSGFCTSGVSLATLSSLDSTGLKASSSKVLVQ